MNSDFSMALERRDLGALRRCPKADLHIHGLGGGDREFIRKATGVDIAPVERTFRSMAEMHAFADEKLAGLFSGLAGRALAFHATFVQAHKDGVTRLEVGEDAWAITLHEGSAQAVWTMLSGAHRSEAPNIDWIPQLGISRHCPVGAVERWIEPFLELGVFETLDLSGDEFAQPIEAFAPVYRRAKAAGLRLKAHAGEWGTADDVWRTVEVLETGRGPARDRRQHVIAGDACSCERRRTPERLSDIEREARASRESRRTPDPRTFRRRSAGHDQHR